MSVGGPKTVLDQNRDALVNVNAFGDAVQSARFMGGREFEIIQDGYPFDVSQQDVDTVLAEGLMLLPAVEPISGPYKGREMAWSGPEPAIGSGVRAVALSYYLALMTQTCLELTASTGPIIVEGPFARNMHYLAMLRAATGRPVLYSLSSTGTSVGAALLYGAKDSIASPAAVPKHFNAAKLNDYSIQWRELAEQKT